MQDENAFFLFYFHERRLIKLTGIAEVRLDEDNGDFRRQPMLLTNGFFFFANAATAGTMRHQDGKFQHAHAVPQETRLGIDEFQPLKAEFLAAAKTRNERRDNDGD